MGNLAAAGRWDGGVMGRGRRGGVRRRYGGGAAAGRPQRRRGGKAPWDGWGIARAAALRDDWEFVSVADYH